MAKVGKVQSWRQKLSSGPLRESQDLSYLTHLLLPAMYALAESVSYFHSYNMDADVSSSVLKLCHRTVPGLCFDSKSSYI